MAEQLKIRLVLDDAELKRRRTREEETRKPARRELTEKREREGSDIDRDARKASSSISSSLSGPVPGLAAASAVAGLVTLVGPILSETLQSRSGDAAEMLAQFTPGGLLARLNGTYDSYMDQVRETAEAAAKNVIDPAIDAIQSAVAGISAGFATFAQGKQVAGAFASLDSIPDLERQGALAAALYRVNYTRMKFNADIEESLLRLGTRGVVDAITETMKKSLRTDANAGVAR